MANFKLHLLGSEQLLSPFIKKEQTRKSHCEPFIDKIQMVMMLIQPLTNRIIYDNGAKYKEPNDKNLQITLSHSIN